MRSVPKAVLLLAAWALPIAAVLVSFARTDGPRIPEMPATVRMGSSPGTEPTLLTPIPSVELAPPAPDGDDDDHDD